jgi:hypothetical protein
MLGSCIVSHSNGYSSENLSFACYWKYVRFIIIIIIIIIIVVETVPWIRRLLAGLSPGRPGFNSRPGHVRVLVDSVC